MNKELESKSIEALARKFIIEQTDTDPDGAKGINLIKAFKAGYSLNQSLRWVKASERMPSETKPYNIKYGIAPEVGWYNSLDKQFYGDILEKYPLDNKSILWLDESPSLQK